MSIYLDAMRAKGTVDAAELQQRAPEMDGTEIYAESEKVPDFKAAVAAKNMLKRKAGFVCRSSAGRMVRLLQPYDSEIYLAEPEELPAQWGFAWSTDPRDALPFVQLATSPYMIGDCCTEGGKTYRSTMDHNTHVPSEYPAGWEETHEN